MWMMGYSDGGEINGIQDPFSGRKLRPLMPRPASGAPSINPPCFTRIHGTDFLTLNHHLEQNKRDLSTQQVVVSSRWNPTPEQLQTLEELYRRGTRTPSADQIQHITAQLRRYGKIEGKNVFYWFQNHKARERQKRRRQLDDEQTTEKRDPAAGGNRTAFEVEQTKNWASPTNSSTLPEKAEAECKGADGWVQLDVDDAEVQRRRNATWRGMNLSCSSSATSHLLLNSCAPTTVTSALPSTMQMKPQDFLNIFLEPYTPTAEEAQTLQLFPLRSSSSRGDDDECSDGEGEEEEEESGAAAAHVTPFQFFEFLPLKN